MLFMLRFPVNGGRLARNSLYQKEPKTAQHNTTQHMDNLQSHLCFGVADFAEALPLVSLKYHSQLECLG